MGRNLKSPLGDISGVNNRPKSRKIRKIGLSVTVVSALAIALGASGVFAATLSFLGDLFLSVGSSQSAPCVTNSSISVTQSVNSSGTVEIDAITVAGISSECDGEVVAAVIYDSGSTILDEVIWTLELTTGDTEISAVADGTTLASSNSSSGGVSTNYPATQTDPEGLTPSLLASDVDRVEFLHLHTTRAARE